MSGRILRGQLHNVGGFHHEDFCPKVTLNGCGPESYFAWGTNSDSPKRAAPTTIRRAPT